MVYSFDIFDGAAHPVLLSDKLSPDDRRTRSFFVFDPFYYFRQQEVVAK